MPQVVPAERSFDPGPYQRRFPRLRRTSRHGLPFIGEDVRVVSRVVAAILPPRTR